MTDVVSGLQSTLAARYVVEREIGEGSTAHVYLARDTRHDRPVALKILRPELANALSGERFLREIRVAAGLQHPNILALYDSGETADSLYFVMPFVAGETLRDRLARGGALGVDEAVRILSEIADALTYAHSRGVVHRDVKPENIILADGHAFIGDFGIAYAARFAPDARLTGEGRVVGTAPYMSPEQAAGDESVDGRSDQYSLACVFHEMLSGRTLYAGSTPRTAMSRLSTPPPRLRKSRRDVPAAVDRALARALAPDPAGRFATPKAFADSVAEALTSAVVTRRVSWRTAAVAAFALSAASVAVGVYFWRGKPAPPLDRGLYAVMPFTHVGTPVPELAGDDCQLLLLTALSHWRDVRLVDELRVKSTYAEYAGSGADLPRVLDAARALGAGMALWGDVRPLGDSIYVRAALYDVGGGGRTLRAYGVRLARGLADVSRKFRELADSLMLHEQGTSVAADATGTSSLDAWRAYAAGHRALGEWDLARARREFDRAIELDPQYPQAYLWLVQTTELAGMTRSVPWRDAAARAVALRSRLSPADGDVALALLDVAEGRFQEACGRYRVILGRDSLDFRAWYGLGDCQELDRLVVEDRRSPSGWRFRSSQAAAIRAYARALALTPAAHRAFRGRGFSRLSELFSTDVSGFKPGYRLAGGDTIRYGAFPSLDADTITFVPYPLADLYAGRPATRPATVTAAVARNRELLSGLTERWIRAFPVSPDAAEAHARALELAGELTSPQPARSGALQMVRRARALAHDPGQRFTLAASDVRLLLKTGQFELAARLADSLVASAPSPDAQVSMRAAGLAALTGRVHAAAALFADAAPAFPQSMQPMLPDGTPVSVPAVVLKPALSLTTYAAFGAPADSVRTLWRHVATSVETWVAAPDRARVALAILHRPAALGYDVLGPTPLHRNPPPNALWILEQQAALLRADTALLRARADAEIARARTVPTHPFSTTYVFHTVRQLLATRDTARAAAFLELFLEALPSAPEDLLDDAVDAATLVRALALRAELAAAGGDAAGAARSASAVAALWRAADPPLTGLLARMRSIVAQGGRLP